MSKPEYVYVSYIQTTPEKLWTALTSAEFTKKYWIGTAIESTWKVGAPFKFVGADGVVTTTGEILVFDKPRVLSYSFQSMKSEASRKEKPSKVTFLLEPAGGSVRLTVTHEGFPVGTEVLDKVASGWPFVLSSLKSLLENGTVPAREAFVPTC